MKKTVSLFLAALTALCLSVQLCSCGKDAAVTSEPETTAEPYVMKDISGIPSPVSINGKEIPYAVFRYYYAAVKYQYDLDDDSFWTYRDLDEKLRETAMRYVRRNAALEEAAGLNGVSLSDPEKNKAKQNVASSRYSSYENDEDYYRALDEYYLTEETNLYLEELSLLEEKLFEYMKSPESGPRISSSPELVKRYIDKYVIRADHILIKNDEGDDVNENETLINELCEKLKNGADFDELKSKYSEDTATKNDGTGYYIAEGDMSQEFSDAAFSLQPGEISGVIYAPYGWHIVKRLEPDQEYIDANADGYFLEFYQQHMFEAILKKLMDAQKIEYDASYGEITPLTIK